MIFLLACAEPAPPPALDFNLVVPTVTRTTLTPATGRLAGAAPESPGTFRLFGATSSDGERFTSLGPIADQANVPDVVADAKGTLYLYYTAGIVNGVRDGLAVAISTNRGRSWTHYAARVTGQQATPTDPDVALLPEGTIRMWYTAPIGAKPGVAWAESRDGIDFTYGGTAFAPEVGAMDPNTWRVGDTWHMLTLDGRGEPLLHATSTDGHTFRSAEPMRFEGRDIASNAVRVGTGVRMFAFTKGAITSYLATDGLRFTKEKGARIAPSGSGLEGPFLKDAAVARLPDGGWFAAYVTPIP